LLPGSRRNELHRIIPGLAASLPLITSRVPGVQFMVAAAPNLPEALFAPLSSGLRPRSPVESGLSRTVPIVRERTDDVLAACDVAITASGTATVQAALHERPMVVVYKLSPLTYRLGKPFVHVDTYAMANLVAGKRIVPELIQDDFTPERVAEECVRLLTDEQLRKRTEDELRRVRERLGGPGASARAAEAVLTVARAKSRNRER
jgi:lipid-A-disaccharide synthase